MASPKKIREIMAAVSIPVMAKCRIGHFAEAQILQELGVDYIDESEVLTPADEAHHVDKHAFTVPFVCGARNLGEALRRIAEGAAMIRTKGEAGTGDVVHAVKHIRQIVQEMKILTVLSEEELYAKAKEHQAPYELIKMVAKAGKLPVPNFSAGGIATPADASLVMQLGAEAVFVGSGIFMKNSTEFADPAEAAKRARAIVQAATHYQDPKVLLEVSEDLQGAMKGLAVSALDEAHMLQTRGW
jgi:pyridoxal 5'-phosphate synthase pdxS subunit